MKLIDFGGGFGIPYFPVEKELDLKLLSKGLRELFNENAKIFDYKNVNLIAESGRFLVAESGVFFNQSFIQKAFSGKNIYYY